LYKTGEDLVRFRETRSPLALTKMQNKESNNNKSNTKIQEEHKFKSIEIISRDLNGAMNILYKGRCILEEKEIPKYMKRSYPILSRTA
jgi:hypothetical protein